MKKLGCTSSEQQIFNAKIKKTWKTQMKNVQKNSKRQNGKIIQIHGQFLFLSVRYMWIVQFIRPCFRLYHFSVELPFQWEICI